MSILNKIIPFYGAIEELVKTAGDAVRADQERRTLVAKAQIEVYLKTEVEKIQAEIRQREARQKAETDIYLQTEIDRRKFEINEKEKKNQHDRQIEFEKHRVALFEQIKQFEIDIHKEVMKFEIEEQKKIAEWQRSFNRRLETELEETLTNRVPRMLEQALKFEEKEAIYTSYVDRIFKVADKISESIVLDQEYFRDRLKDLSQRPQQLTEGLHELNRRLTFTADQPAGLLEK